MSNLNQLTFVHEDMALLSMEAEDTITEIQQLIGDGADVEEYSAESGLDEGLAKSVLYGMQFNSISKLENGTNVYNDYMKAKFTQCRVSLNSIRDLVPVLGNIANTIDETALRADIASLDLNTVTTADLRLTVVQKLRDAQINVLRKLIKDSAQCIMDENYFYSGLDEAIDVLGNATISVSDEGFVINEFAPKVNVCDEASCDVVKSLLGDIVVNPLPAELYVLEDVLKAFDRSLETIMDTFDSNVTAVEYHRSVSQEISNIVTAMYFFLGALRAWTFIYGTTHCILANIKQSQVTE